MKKSFIYLLSTLIQKLAFESHSIYYQKIYYIVFTEKRAASIF